MDKEKSTEIPLEVDTEVENSQETDGVSEPKGEAVSSGNGVAHETVKRKKARPKHEKTVEQKIAEYEDQLKRLAAEFANYKRRVETEQETLWERLENRGISEILPLLDDLWRLQAHADDDNNLQEGVDAVAQKWQQWLELKRIERIEAEGCDFDPELHDALMRQPVDDPAQSGQVVQVLEHGYKRGDTVLRHAKVAVGFYEDNSTSKPIHGESESTE